MELPHGVRFDELKSHSDHRGVFTEVYRESWIEGYSTIQWNVVHSKARTLRGVHVHKVHHDYLTVVKGRALFGLHDLRPDSPTHQLSSFVEFNGEKMNALIIPPGVAHGFYFFDDATHVYGVSEYWNLADELGCHFLDPKLNLDWPDKEPLLSERDQNMGTYDELVATHFAS